MSDLNHQKFNETFRKKVSRNQMTNINKNNIPLTERKKINRHNALDFHYKSYESFVS